MLHTMLTRPAFPFPFFSAQFADNQLRDSMSTLIRSTFEVLGTFVVISIITRGWLCAALVPILYGYFRIMQCVPRIMHARASPLVTPDSGSKC